MHFENNAEIQINRSMNSEYDGLSIVVDHLIEDTASTYYSFYGSIVYVADNIDYFDEASGGLIQRMFQPRDELFISMKLVPVSETDAIRSYAPNTRECLFQDENSLGK